MNGNTLGAHTKSSIESCSKCFKCRAEFDTGDEFYSHMKLNHGVQFSKGHWRNCPVGDRGEESSKSHDVPVFNTGEETTHTLSPLTTDKQVPAASEKSILPSSDAQNEQPKDLPKITLEESNVENMEADQEASPRLANSEKHYCSICNNTFATQWALDRHKERQRRKFLL